MANITVSKFECDGLEFYVDESTGLAYAPISMVARLCCCEPIQVKRLLTGDKESLKSALIKTSNGDKAAKLIDAKDLFRVAIVHNPELALKMGAAGANVYMCGLAGYQTAIAAKPKTALELAREQVKLLEQIELQQAQIELLEEDNLALSTAVDQLWDRSTIKRVAAYNNCSEKAFNWRILKAAAKALGEEIYKVPDINYPNGVNVYSHDAWRLAYPGYKLPETTTLKICGRGQS